MTVRIADLAQRALAVVEENPAHGAVLARLALAQQQKAANIIAYLNSDVSGWSEGDEAVLRQYLGLAAAPLVKPSEADASAAFPPGLAAAPLVKPSEADASATFPAGLVASATADPSAEASSEAADADEEQASPASEASRVDGLAESIGTR